MHDMSSFSNKSPDNTEKVVKLPIRVGFDLDGVLFFNPLRVVRKPIELVKRHILKKNTMQFYIPKSRAEKLMWKIVHMSSLKPAKGYELIRELKEKGIIEPYIITARFACLANDFKRCVKRLKGNEYFAGTFYNEQDEQPHLFKERMVKKLGLDFFVEDNWNIVDHLRKNTNTKVLWISNAMDQDIAFDERHPDLESAVQKLAKLIISKN
ncbi:MAG: hypothetical protein U0525_06230 [Patescibacteria group bacterium]